MPGGQRCNGWGNYNVRLYSIALKNAPVRGYIIRIGILESISVRQLDDIRRQGSASGSCAENSSTFQVLQALGKNLRSRRGTFVHQNGQPPGVGVRPGIDNEVQG